MKTPVVKLIIVIVVILLIGSVSYTVLHLQSSQEQYEKEAQRHFSNLVEEASLLYRASEETQERFSQFRKNLRDYRKLRSLVLYDADGKIHYVYARNSSALSFVGPRTEQLELSAVRQFERPRLDTSLSSSIPTRGTGAIPITIQAVYETLSHTALTESIKFLLLTLTGLLLILGTALLLLPPAVHPVRGANEKESFYADESGIPQVPEEYYRPAAGFPRSGTRKSPSETEEEAARETASDLSKEPDPSKVSETEISETKEYVQEEEKHKSSEIESKKEENFFSATSRLVRGDFFLSRLESELKRAASFDQDLTLMLFRCPETHNADTFTSLAEKAKAFFTFHDLIFELPEHTIGIILPNTDLDEGITQSSNFQKKLFEEGDARITDIRLGLSSRNGRLVEAERLYGEAQAALYKAQHDPDHPSIMGFRPDPNKYRQYLSVVQ